MRSLSSRRPLWGPVLNLHVHYMYIIEWNIKRRCISQFKTYQNWPCFTSILSIQRRLLKALDAGKRNLTYIIIVLYKETVQTAHWSGRTCEALPKVQHNRPLWTCGWVIVKAWTFFFLFSGKQQAEDFHHGWKNRFWGTYQKAYLDCPLIYSVIG